MKKLINELVEMANEGYDEILLVYNKKFNSIGIYFTEDEKVIPKEYIIGTLDLSVYNTFDDIKEELESMLND